MTADGIIFDVDGVIADSEYYFTNSCALFLNAQGIDVSYKDIIRYLGQPEMVVVRQIRKDWHLERYDEKQLFDLLYADYVKKMASGEVHPMEGLERFLDILKQKNIRTALGTSGSIPHVQEILNGIRLENRFDTWVTVEKVTKGKPDPEIFNTAADELCAMGCQRDRIIVIEDSPNGIRAGKAAGLFTIGLKASRIPQDTSEADAVCYTYEEVIKLISKGE